MKVNWNRELSRRSQEPVGHLLESCDLEALPLLIFRLLTLVWQSAHTRHYSSKIVGSFPQLDRRPPVRKLRLIHASGNNLQVHLSSVTFHDVTRWLSSDNVNQVREHDSQFSDGTGSNRPSIVVLSQELFDFTRSFLGSPKRKGHALVFAIILRGG